MATKRKIMQAYNEAKRASQAGNPVHLNRMLQIMGENGPGASLMPYDLPAGIPLKTLKKLEAQAASLTDGAKERFIMDSDEEIRNWDLGTLSAFLNAVFDGHTSWTDDSFLTVYK